MNCTTHENHTHEHKAGCGHKSVEHDGHIDYLHDGHLHHSHDGHIDEHVLTDGPSDCTPEHICAQHDKAHEHGPDCGHESVPHAGHMDYLVGGHLHHPCEKHCDDHGSIVITAK